MRWWFLKPRFPNRGELEELQALQEEDEEEEEEEEKGEEDDDE